jgi:hypothetical protein
MNVEDDIDDPLRPLVEKIAEGSAVDREMEQERAGHDSDPAMLEALLEIAAIQAAHRGAERIVDRETPTALAVPGQWCHLTILEKIGAGTFGEVYRAYDSKLQIDVALKLSPIDSHQTPRTSSVLNEARLLAKVRHPNVVRVYGADQDQGYIGLWMDLVNGQTLEELTSRQGFSASEAINIGIEMCRGLAAVHAVGVLHGDIKAHNIMRRNGGEFLLVDFGAGRPLTTEPRTGHDVIGTPVYMAPEVLDGQPRSTASDIYSLGVLLFHLVTNEYPIYARSRDAFIEAHHAGSRKRLRDLRPDLTDGFIQVVERATATDPRMRFASAGALEAALVQLMTSSQPPPVAGTSWRLLPALLGAAAALAIAAVLFSGVLRPATVPAPAGLAARNGDVLLPAESYEIEAAFFRKSTNGEERLAADSRLRLNDEIHLAVQTSAPAYLYVVNEDDKGEAFLLFPQSDMNLTNPVAPNRQLRLPGAHNWAVNSAGGKEHFIVFSSKAPVPALEEAFKRLPSPKIAAASRGEPLRPEILDNLRSVGTLIPVRQRSNTGSHFRDVFNEPLVGRETVTGLWARQLTLDNIGR